LVSFFVLVIPIGRLADWPIGRLADGPMGRLADEPMGIWPMCIWGFYLKIELRGSNVSLQGLLLPFAGWSY
jgi:hypothetical protein